MRDLATCLLVVSLLAAGCQDIDVSNSPPAIILVSPGISGDTATDTFTIEWLDDDPDSDAVITLYYDTDDLGNNGVEIVSGISENSPVDSYVWSTVAVVPGDYYICARIDDGVNTTEYIYSDGLVTIPTNDLGVPKSEYDALVALYNATGGPTWGDNTGWLTSSTPWYGVTVLGGHVAEIALSSNNLVGTIPTEIAGLTQLTHLDLGLNDLSGGIPPEIGSLTQLTTLDLRGNDFGGSIPPEIGDLAQLTTLCLNGCDLSGAIPPEIGGLTQLTSLELSGNSLSGSIPPEIGDLTQLTYCHFGNNSLSGSIPPEIGDLTQLTMLILWNNSLSGSIPPEIGALTQVTSLYLNSNNLSGSIPPEIGDLLPRTT